MDGSPYIEVEKRVLRTVIEKLTFDRWASLCAIMSDGLYIAAERYDRDLPTRGWLHICARCLALIPERENRDRRLAANEFFDNEVEHYCEVYRPVIQSLRHYMHKVYPKFDPKTGKWGRAGKENRDENPFPFVIGEYLSEDEEDDVLAMMILFDIVPDDNGEVFCWTPIFNEELARVTDDYDAELECGEFAGNVDEEELKEIVEYMENQDKGEVSHSELDTLANIMVSAYNATIEMHRSILENRGFGRFASEDFDRSSLFHQSFIQPALALFQPHILSTIERCGVKVQQYRTPTCDMLDIAQKVKVAWCDFFRQLKRQFNGNARIVDAESAASRMVEHYYMKIASEGGGLHISASTVEDDYKVFIGKFEQIAIVVAQNDYAARQVKWWRSKIARVLGTILTSIIATVLAGLIVNMLT